MRLAGLVLLAAWLAPATAQEAPLFAEDTPIDVELAFDLKTVADDRSESPPWRPAALTHTGPGGASATLRVGLRTRGHYRLHYLDCDLPPLRVNVRTREAGGTLFEGQDKLKLVTHCETRGRDWEQYVLQEHLIYQAYALLTDASFRTRLARVTYRDSTGRRDAVTRFGFFIEDDDRMAARIGGEIVGRTQIHPNATDREQATLLSVFHYMIGNTDWGISRLHNTRLVYRQAVADSLNEAGVFDGTASALVAVPYDFDWSGLISTSYATPDPQLGIRTVRQRRYLGFCHPPDVVDPALDRFHAREADLYALFREAPHLDAKVAERSVEYLESFFEQISTPRGVERAFHRDCQGG